MLVNYTPLSQLTAQELMEAKQRCAMIAEGSGGMILTSGRSLSASDCQALRLQEQQRRGPAQMLFG